MNKKEATAALPFRHAKRMDLLCAMAGEGIYCVVEKKEKQKSENE